MKNISNWLVNLLSVFDIFVFSPYKHLIARRKDIHWTDKINKQTTQASKTKQTYTVFNHVSKRENRLQLFYIFD